MSTIYKSITWEKFHKDARLLSCRIQQASVQFIGLVAVTRGGMMPACILARELNCRIIHTISIITYQNGIAVDHPTVLFAPNLPQAGEGFLFVDDLVDTGVTARVIMKLYPKAKLVCLYAKPLGNPFAHHFVEEVEQNTWIIFPWESSEETVGRLKE